MRGLILQRAELQYILDKPVVSLVPRPLADKRLADLKDGLRISRFGYSVQVPWTKTKRSNDFKTATIVAFENGASIVMLDPANHMDMLTAAPEDEAAWRGKLRSILGERATRSHFDYAKAELAARPGDVSFFHSDRAKARGLMFLTMKTLEIPEGTTAIYSVAAPGFRGFQFGDPQKGRTFVELLLFDEHDRALELILRGPKNEIQPVLTQEQINAMVASVRAEAQ